MKRQATRRTQTIQAWLRAGCLGLALAGLALPRPAHAQTDEPGGIGGTGITPETGGIGGTGVTPAPQPIIGYGPIQAFGSVFVNNREYEINAHTLVSIDGAPATLAALRVGDIAHVQGVVTGPRSGFAQAITVTHEIAGPVSAVSATGGEMTVLGQRVIIANALVPGVRPGVLPGQFVEIAAQQRGDGAWVAHRVSVLGHAGPVQLLAPLMAVGPGYVTVAGTRFAAAAPLTHGLILGERVLVTGLMGAGGLQAVSVTPAPVALGVAGTQVEVQSYFKQAGAGRLVAPDGVTAEAGPAGLAASGLSPVEVSGRVDETGAIDIDRIADAPAEPVVAVPQPAAPAMPEMRDTEPLHGIDIDKIPDAAGPDKDAPEVEPLEVRPELPDLEAPEIHGPPDD